MIKRIALITIIAVVVVSLAAVAIARYQRSVYPAIARGLSVATDGGGLSNLETDTFIAAAKATAAPEFAKGIWINSDPLTLDKLRGRVVLVEFWTFGCYNCRNTLPSVKDWDARYHERGLTLSACTRPKLTANTASTTSAKKFQAWESSTRSSLIMITQPGKLMALKPGPQSSCSTNKAAFVGCTWAKGDTKRQKA